jgi:hypothetical protein
MIKDLLDLDIDAEYIGDQLNSNEFPPWITFTIPKTATVDELKEMLSKKFNKLFHFNNYYQKRDIQVWYKDSKITDIIKSTDPLSKIKIEGLLDYNILEIRCKCFKATTIS